MSRLEQIDSYLRSFESRVAELERGDDASWVRLDASAFYPTSGGQPHDVGRLGGLPVTEVQLRDGRVWHRLEGGALEPGAAVRGEIDWGRRYRHMQRHSAQHLLSQAFVRLDEAFATRSVSLSSADCTLDLAGEPTAADLDAAQRRVREIVYGNLPITAFEIDESELADHPLRRPAKVTGRIRLVAMGDWELSACGGTHLRHTSEAGPVKLLRAERVRGGLLRVTFRAGLEAQEDYDLKHEVTAGLALAFSAQPAEVPERVEALREQLGAAKRELSALQERLAATLAETLLAQAEAAGAARVVRLTLPAADAELLRPLGSALQATPGTVALLAVAGDRAQLLFARSDDLPYDMNALLRRVLPEIGGRGGGRPAWAQGGGESAEGLERALERALAQLRG